MEHSLSQAAELACHQPKRVAGRVLKAGLCETDLYLACQELYGEIARRNKSAAEIFAQELLRKGLALACAGRESRPG